MNMQSCADICNECHKICLHAAMTHCLEAGGDHLEPKHFRLMLSCAKICQTSSDLQLLGSAFSMKYCELCAEVCDACAESCEALDNMEDCAKICRTCAQSCRDMSTHAH